jgi:hypothetical protein
MRASHLHTAFKTSELHILHSVQNIGASIFTHLSKQRSFTFSHSVQNSGVSHPHTAFKTWELLSTWRISFHSIQRMEVLFTRIKNIRVSVHMH